MATGDIGSVIEARSYSSKAIYSPLRVPGTNYWIAATSYGSTQDAAVVSFACDSEGNISDSVITLLVFNTATYGNPTSQVFHVSGYVYALVYRTFNTPYNGRVATFSINPSTGVLTQINDVIIGAGSSYNMTGQVFQNCVHVYGTVFACVGLDTHSGQWYTIETFSISADGTSISLIQRIETAAAGQTQAAIIELAPNKFAVLANIASGNVMLYTYTITDAGAITLIDSEVIDAGGQYYRVGIINVYGTTYLLAYACAAANRLRTITIGDDGTIGASIDTDDTIMAYREVYALSFLPGLFALIGSGGNGSNVRTFALSYDGTIGAVIDSAGFGSYLYGFEYSGQGEVYVGGYDSVAFSVDVVVPTPEIETIGYSDVRWNRATLWGNIVEASTAQYYGFEWSEDTGTFENEEVFATPQPGVFNADITGLSAGTSYKFRAFIELDGVRSYGDVRGFITSYPIPEVETEPPVATGDDYITAEGVLWDNPASDIDEFGFVFGYSQVDDTEGAFGWNDPPETAGYDFVKKTVGALGASFLSDDAAAGQKKATVENVSGFVEAQYLSENAASGQKVVVLDYIEGYSAGMNVRIKDGAAQEDNVIAEVEVIVVAEVQYIQLTMLNDLANTYTTGANAFVGQIVHITDNASEEDAVVVSISGDELTMESNLANAYATADAARIHSVFTIKLDQLQYSRRYYYRAYAHNSYGYAYGSEIVALTSDTVNLLYPTATYSKGIRFCIPGKLNFPPTGMYYDTRHHLCVRSEDSHFVNEGAFGWVVGKYVAERQYWSEATNVDLYTMSNPTRRTGTIIKVKYKCRIGNNSYGAGPYHKRVINNGASSLTSDYIGYSAYIGWYCEVFYDNPWTSGAWAVTEVDDLRMGISIRSGTGFEQPMCDVIEGRVCWANAAVTTLPGEAVTETSAKLFGQVTEDEAEDCEVFFEYGETVAYGSETTPQAAVKGQYFDDTITGLDPAKNYHYRAAITTACGETFYGEDRLMGQDRIYVWLGDEAMDEKIELTSPSYPMVLYARTERGWDEELAEASSGIAEIICDNFFGDFSPENTGGQYYGELVLGRWLTVYEIYQGVQYNHFTGKIDKILPTDDPDNPVAYISAVDGMDDLAATAVSTVLRQDTDVGELAGDILDACGWSAGTRDIDTGVDTLEFGWFHKRKGIEAMRDLELTEKGRFFVKANGVARFENRHARITGDGLVSQHTFDDTAIRLEYELSKRLLYNEVLVTGRRYTAGGVQLFSGYDLGELESDLVWSAHTGDDAAPYVPQNSSLTLWAEFGSPLSTYDTLVKGTHWNANTASDKTGDDVSDNISIAVTQYGQALKLVITNAGNQGAYIVEPDSPPEADLEDKTLLIFGVLFSSENVTVLEEDAASQSSYGKRTLEIDAPFKSRPNDILAYSQWLLARYHLPVANPIQIAHIARAGWPDDTLRIQCLVREISDRITIGSTKLGFDRDFYINKVVQEYAMNEGGMVHETTWVVEQAEGSAEGLYWLLGVEGFGELGEATILGF
jgi:hypothetical protein